jgi:thiopurine S-methyltransferase
MTENWISRWQDGRIGWHEADGNAALQKFWPTPGNGERVLVPLCGKSADLLWLAQQGYDVTGVELSDIALRAFFEESGIEFETRTIDGLLVLRSSSPRITLVCCDYFDFSSNPFDALYDRASLIALPGKSRPEYVRHTKSLLKSGATQLLITLEYDQSQVDGPPYSVLADEVADHWGDLQWISGSNVIDGLPPKFRESTLTQVTESVWLSKRLAA